MSNFEEGIDPQLRTEFIDESLDGLEDVSGLLVELESSTDFQNTVQAIFRPVHSIKGNSAYFGLLRTKSLAHELETLLDLIRKGALTPAPEIVDVLLRGADRLQSMLGRVRNGEDEAPDEADLDAFIATVKAAAAVEREDEETLWRSLFAKLQSGETAEMLPLARKLAQTSTAGKKALDQEAPSSPSQVGVPAAVAELRALLEQAAEPNADDVRRLFAECGAPAPSPETAAAVERALADVDLLVATVGLGDLISKETLLGDLDALAAALAAPRGDVGATAPQPQETPAVTSGAAAKATGKTMRIPEERIDVFLSYVGDLVTVGEMYTHLSTNLASGMDGCKGALELRRINDSFRELSLALQTSIMNVRKLPMSTILQRAPRMVRDVAQARGKEIEARVSGGDLLADKSLVDALEAPLTHMVRNAADHGIESPEARRASGKPPAGLIEITALETSDDIVLTVQDDGKGLDLKALAAKAAELGMIAPNAALSENDLVNLLFMSGVSTAKEITDVSGRGVGMDVVKRNIEQMNGRICVKTEAGKGTLFSVRLPKTVSTQILTGFVVRVGGNRYIFPLETIVRCFRLESKELHTVQGRGECVKDGDRLLPLCRLSTLFARGRRNAATVSTEEGVIVVVEQKAQTIAVHVDGIDGVKQVVLKGITGFASNEEFFVGGAVMGDGSVAMVVNVERIGHTGQHARIAV